MRRVSAEARTLRRNAGFCLIALTLVPTTVAHAQVPGAIAETAPTVSLVWEDSDLRGGCVNRETFVHAVDGFAGHRIFVPAPRGAAFVRVTIARNEAGTTLATVTLEAVDGTILGRRQFESVPAGCDDLAQALALAAVLIIDSARAAVPSGPLHVPPRDRPRDEGWIAEVGPTASVALGRLPGPAAGFGLRAVVAPRPAWPTELGLVTWLPVRSHDPLAAASLDGWRISLAECPRVRVLGVLHALRLGGCLGVEVDQTHAEPRGLPGGVAQTSTWLGVLAGTNASFALARHLALRVDLGIGVPFQRDYFYYTGPTGAAIVAFRPSAVDADASVGLLVTIP